MRCIIMAKAVSTPWLNGSFDAFSTAAVHRPDKAIRNPRLTKPPEPPP